MYSFTNCTDFSQTWVFTKGINYWWTYWTKIVKKHSVWSVRERADIDQSEWRCYEDGGGGGGGLLYCVFCLQSRWLTIRINMTNYLEKRRRTWLYLSFYLTCFAIVKKTKKLYIKSKLFVLRHTSLLKYTVSSQCQTSVQIGDCHGINVPDCKYHVSTWAEQIDQ